MVAGNRRREGPDSRSPCGFASAPAPLRASPARLAAGRSQFATVVSVDVASGSCEVLNDTDPTLAERCVQSGFERHGAAFALLGRWRSW